jgi:hypothetical protein
MRSAAFFLPLLLAGCAAKHGPVAAVKPHPEHSREFVDLQAGWRLRIIAPVTKSGSYTVGTKPMSQQGKVITLKASDDLIGYETSYWALTARPGGGLSIRMTSALLTKAGVPEPILKPTRAAVHVPKYARFIRLFYLLRKSDADHDMAVLGAGRMDRLESLTQALRESPRNACVDQPRDRTYCEWVPAGMAVRQEVPKLVDGVMTWPER